MACHNGLTTPAGEDVSIGVSWRASMMAHSSRDPYWQGAVRREAIDHPEHAAAIEDECSICHMPMTTYPARAAGGLGKVFAHLPIGGRGTDPLAADGVSCTVCHQITNERLGSPESFTGGYVLNVANPAGPQPMFGPFEVDDGRTHVMRSATGLTPTESIHVRQLRAVRHVPHAVHHGARRRGPRGGQASRAGAVPRVAAQRVQHGTELPGLPHAAGRRADADCLGPRRAARGSEPPHLPRRQLLHAADAEPLPQRPGRDGAAPRTRSRRDGYRAAAASRHRHRPNR